MNLRIADMRRENDLSQEQLAKILGIARQTYNHYEVQENIIPIKHLIAISEICNVSVDYLLYLSNERQYKNMRKSDLILSGQRLKKFRKDNKLTQVKLAEILNTTFSNLAFYEKGRNFISTPFLYVICKNYKVSADYLLGKIDSPKYLK